jgi:hypothetical protein
VLGVVGPPTPGQFGRDKPVAVAVKKRLVGHYPRFYHPDPSFYDGSG